MMSDMGSNYHYFAYEPALKYSFDINFLDEMKSCGDIVRYEYCDREKKTNFARGTAKWSPI